MTLNVLAETRCHKTKYQAYKPKERNGLESGGQDKDKIEMVRKHAVPYVCKNYAREKGCVTRIVQHLGWRSLLQRRVDIRLIFRYKCVHGLVTLDISNHLNAKTRPSHRYNSMSYNIPVETRTHRQKSFLPLTITQ